MPPDHSGVHRAPTSFVCRLRDKNPQVQSPLIAMDAASLHRLRALLANLVRLCDEAQEDLHNGE